MTAAGALMLGGLFVAALRNIPSYIGLLSARIGIASVVIADDDDLFAWCAYWLHREPSLRRVRDLRASLASSSRSDWDDDDLASDILLTPGDGHHLFWYRNRPFWLERNRSSGGRYLRETLTLRTIARDRRPIEELLADIRATYLAILGNRLRVYANDGDRWELVSSRDPRPLSSVVLPDGVADTLVSDVQQFRDSQLWYRDLGIPHRRGYLFYGPPGTGKSSLVGALAGHFRAPVYALHLAARDLTDDRLLALFSRIPPAAFVLLEDVDAAFAQRRTSDDHRLTLSGLLNAIDGVAAKDGIALVLTTNHLERLDPALVRPGRVDIRIAFAYASTSQVERLYQRFFPNSRLASLFAGRLEPDTIPISSLQEFLLERRFDEARALDDVTAWAASTATHFRQYRNGARKDPEGSAHAGPSDVSSRLRIDWPNHRYDRVDAVAGADEALAMVALHSRSTSA